MEQKKVKITIINPNDVKLFQYVRENFDYIVFAVEKKEEIEIMKNANIFNFKNGAKIIRRDANGIIQQIETEKIDYKRKRA